MKFVEAQELRRETHTMIADIQKRIKDLHVELEKTNRGEDRYLVLVTQKRIKDLHVELEKTNRG